MSTNDINITIDHISKAPSVASEDDDSHGAALHASPPYSDKETRSQSGSSEPHESYPDPPWPSESPDGEETHPHDALPPAVPHRHRTVGSSRSSSGRRQPTRRHTTQARESVTYRVRHPAPASPPPESVDSAEEFLRGPVPRPGPPQRQSYYGPVMYPQPGYAHSSSSGGSYVQYPPMDPATGHVVSYANPPAPPPNQHGAMYPSMGPPPPVGYPPSHAPYHYPVSHHPGSQVSSPYTSSPYVGTPQMLPYAAPPTGYFPAPYQQPYVHPQYMGQWPMQSPPVPNASPPATAHPSAAAAPSVDQEELVKRVEAMLLKEKEERTAKEEAREAELKAEAKAAADKAERAASDAKIAEEAASKAASKAKEEAEKKAKEDADKAKEDADAKLKEAEENLAKAKKEAEEAAKKASAPPVDERKAPIRFHDAVGRKFNFPWHLCTKWNGMEEMIRQAFEHVEDIGPHVQSGHYDLMGPDGGIIIPSAWETTIEPDWKITMHMWPLPEKKEDELPPLEDGILNLDDLLDPVREKRPKSKGPSKSNSKKATSSGGGFGSWMLGGKPRPKPSLKGEKRPDASSSVAGFRQHAAAAHDQSDACSVM